MNIRQNSRPVLQLCSLLSTACHSLHLKGSLLTCRGDGWFDTPTTLIFEVVDKNSKAACRDGETAAVAASIVLNVNMAAGKQKGGRLPLFWIAHSSNLLHPEFMMDQLFSTWIFNVAVWPWQPQPGNGYRSWLDCIKVYWIIHLFSSREQADQWGETVTKKHHI